MGNQLKLRDTGEDAKGLYAYSHQQSIDEQENVDEAGYLLQGDGGRPRPGA